MTAIQEPSASAPGDLSERVARAMVMMIATMTTIMMMTMTTMTMIITSLYVY